MRVWSVLCAFWNPFETAQMFGSTQELLFLLDLSHFRKNQEPRVFPDLHPPRVGSGLPYILGKYLVHKSVRSRMDPKKRECLALTRTSAGLCDPPAPRFERLAPAEPFWRVNWSVAPSGELTPCVPPLPSCLACAHCLAAAVNNSSENPGTTRQKVCGIPTGTHTP